MVRAGSRTLVHVASELRLLLGQPVLRGWGRDGAWEGGQSHSPSLAVTGS